MVMTRVSVLITPGYSVAWWTLDFTSLVNALKEHLENATVFKGTLKMVQNELLDCMLPVVREQIIIEAHKSDFLSIQANETMAISTQNRLVLGYIDDRNTMQERFFELIPMQSANAESIGTALSEVYAFHFN